MSNNSNEEELITVIDRGKYRIRIIKRKESEYKDISLLYRGIAEILYRRYLEEIKDKYKDTHD